VASQWRCGCDWSGGDRRISAPGDGRAGPGGQSSHVAAVVAAILRVRLHFHTWNTDGGATPSWSNVEPTDLHSVASGDAAAIAWGRRTRTWRGLSKHICYGQDRIHSRSTVSTSPQADLLFRLTAPPAPAPRHPMPESQRKQCPPGQRRPPRPRSHAAAAPALSQTGTLARVPRDPAPLGGAQGLQRSRRELKAGAGRKVRV
jgi:hypothetical protein